MRILVVDDEDEFRAAWASDVRDSAGEHDVVEVPNEVLLTALTTLETRRLAAREGRPAPPEGTPFDNADVLIVDYDLAPISDYGTLTGEAVAYLARAYSGIGLILLLNAVSESFFDLTLRGDADSFADVVLGSRHIGSNGLWHAEFSAFRPWQWPIATVAVDAQRAFAEYLCARLDEPLLEVLGLEAISLSREVRSLVEVSGSSIPTTVRATVTDGPLGLRRKDVLASDDQIAAVASARLRRWLEFDVMSSQDVLVDAPHLVGRIPSLLTGDPNEIATWNATAQLGAASGIDKDRLEQHFYPLSKYLSRDVWKWPSIRSDSQLREIGQPLAPSVKPFLFCEDVSHFLAPDSVREFVADVAGDYVRRFIVDIKMPGGTDYDHALEDVELRPMSRLSRKLV